MGNAKQAIKRLNMLINKDWTDYVNDVTDNLEASTPYDTGRASRSWKQFGKIDIAHQRGRKKLITNRVGYASILDGPGSKDGRPTGKDKQKSRKWYSHSTGIVKPVLAKTRQK